MKFSLVTLLPLFALALLSFSVPVEAQLNIEGAIQWGIQPSGGGLSTNTFQALIIAIGNWLLGLVVGLTMLAIVVGGVMYVVSLGDEQRVGRAKRILVFAVAGLVVAILHGLIVRQLCLFLNVPCTINAPLQNFGVLINNIGNFLLGIVAFLAMAAVVWGGIRYITALGDEGKVAEAKRIILGAVLGVIYVGIHVIIVLAACAVTQGTDIPGCPAGDVASAAEDLGGVILNAIGIFLAILAPIAVGAIAYAAYLYVTSTGEEGRAEQAKRVLLYTVIGIALTVTAAIIVNVVIRLFTG